MNFFFIIIIIEVDFFQHVFRTLENNIEKLHENGKKRDFRQNRFWLFLRNFKSKCHRNLKCLPNT